MVDKVTVHDRCIAIQLQREAEIPCSIVDPFARQRSYKRNQPTTPPNDNQSQFQHYASLPRNKNTQQSNTIINSSSSNPTLTSADNLNIVNQNSNNRGPNDDPCSTPTKSDQQSPVGTYSSGTPTPTNPSTPLVSNGCLDSNKRSHLSNSYQEGYELYRMWVETNAACVWDQELVRAVKGSYFTGVLAGGFILVGGPPRILAAISHAHARALLYAPQGWTIVILGEVQECLASVVPKGQFTPLCDALCWVIHKLSSTGAKTDHVSVCSALLTNFPAMAPPETSIIHAALSDLIRQRKVFHTGRGYGIVYDQSAYLRETSVANALVETTNSSPRKSKQELPPRLLTTSEALTKAHGTTEVQEMGSVRHAAVQTDLADLLTGIWSNSTILTAKQQELSVERTLVRTGSMRL